MGVRLVSGPECGYYGVMSSSSPFSDLADYVAIPRLAALNLSPDGERLVATVQSLDKDRSGYVTSLWEIDPSGDGAPSRLTRGTSSESLVGFTAGGDVLFNAKRDADGGGSGPSLYLLPRSGGEARMIAKRAGGVSSITTAREAGTLLLASPTLPGVEGDTGDDSDVAEARQKSKVSAILHDRYPVRYWDHDLGPATPRLFTAPAPTDDAVVGQDTEKLQLRDVLGHVPGRFGDEASFDVSADGTIAVATWQRHLARADNRATVVRINLADGAVIALADSAERSYLSPQLSPDGTTVVMIWSSRPTPTQAPEVGLAVVSIDGGDVRDVASDWDLWPSAPVWTPDGASVIVVADELGHAPLYRVNIESGERTRLTDDGAFRSHHVSAEGDWVYALRSSMSHPDEPVRVAIDGGESRTLRSPASALSVPGRVEEVVGEAEDGSPLRSFLIVPEGASAEKPAPFLLWIHGGPLGSWNAWSWRWNPWVMAAQGYAVLLPDPALSTGYGQEFIQRGWGDWGGPPYDDLMRITDAALERDDLDSMRTAAMGGSFGGYMANWVAGHTNRFEAIVTHASLWALDQFGPTTDAAFYWAQEMTAEMADANSPHHHLERIETPMLVIHGDRDYRVPIGEALRLWYELVRESADENGDTPHRFLYFPDENHWILTPNNAQAWYATVFAFLAHHVHGDEWSNPSEILSVPTANAET